MRISLKFTTVLLTLLLLLSNLLAFSVAFAANTVVISGYLSDEAGQGLSHVQVTINGSRAKSDQQGQYHIAVAKADIYLLKLSKSGFYTQIQTFSDYELGLTEHKNSEVNSITLVAKKTDRVMLAFGGDVMMGRRFSKPYFGDAVLIRSDHRAEDTKTLLKYVKPYMSVADFASVNLETQIADHKPAQRAPKSVTFYSPPETLTALSWAGIDYVTLGNNHIFDYLNEGLNSTINFLKSSKLGFSGAGLNQQQALTAYHQTVNNNPLAMLGYVGWQGGFSPNQTADENKGGVAYGSMANIINSVSREVGNKQVTVVQYHGSQEYSNNPTGVTEQRLKSALDHGAALAIAHHPHVTQGFELYNNKLIAYSMGNFVFDQYFNEPPLSFILYVWLDSGKFYRAEIVPIYLKGYQPTPATGMQRSAVMKRLAVLSKQRGTVITRSGGHGVISLASQNKTAPIKSEQHSFTLAAGERVLSLYKLPWQKTLQQVLFANENQSLTSLRYRLGTNFVNGSDFESFATFDSQERGFTFDRTNTQVNNFGFSGKHSLALAFNENSIADIGMQSFRRVYKASSPMTITAKVKTKHAIKARFYWQGRKKKQKFFDARANGQKHLIKTISLTGKNDWQSINVDFNSPRIGYRSFRVLVEFELANTGFEKGSQKIDVDDFAVIEWQTAFSKKLTPNYFNLAAQQATYLGIDKSLNHAIKVKMMSSENE